MAYEQKTDLSSGYYPEDDEEQGIAGKLGRFGSPLYAQPNQPAVTEPWKMMAGGKPANYVENRQLAPQPAPPNQQQPQQPQDIGSRIMAAIPGAAQSRVPDSLMAGISSAMPAQPPSGQDTGIPQLLKRQTDLSKPIDPNQPQYKMGIGQRILGSLTNAARGFGGYRGDPINVGSGATNANYDNAERARTGELQGVQGEIAGREKMDDQNRKGFDSAVKAAYEDRIAGARQTAAEAQTDNIGLRRDIANQADATRNRGLDIRSEHDQKLETYRQKLLDAKSQPKNYEQTVLAWALEQDPKRKAQLESAMGRMQRTEAKKFQYKSDRDAQAKGLNPNQAREFDRDPTVINERGRLGALRRALSDPIMSQVMSPAEKQSIKAQMDSSQKAIQGVFDRVKAQNAPRGGPAGNNKPQSKTITKAKVQELATHNKIPYATAEAQFKGKGYIVQ